MSLRERNAQQPSADDVLAKLREKHKVQWPGADDELGNTVLTLVDQLNEARERAVRAETNVEAAKALVTAAEKRADENGALLTDALRALDRVMQERDALKAKPEADPNTAKSLAEAEARATAAEQKLAELEAQLTEAERRAAGAEAWATAAEQNLAVTKPAEVRTSEKEPVNPEVNTGFMTTAELNEYFMTLGKWAQEDETRKEEREAYIAALVRITNERAAYAARRS